MSDSEVALFLRRVNVQHIFSQALAFVDQPFFEHGAEQGGRGQMLSAISHTLASSSRRSESVWRALTVQGLAEAGGEGAAGAQMESTVESIMSTLEPLVKPSERSDLKADLAQVRQEALELWSLIRKDVCRISLDFHPCRATWQALDVPESEAVGRPADTAEPVRATEVEALCIFPRATGNWDDGKEPKILHQGLAVFSDSPVFTLGTQEKHHLLRQIAESRSKAVREHNERNVSISSPRQDIQRPAWPVLSVR